MKTEIIEIVERGRGPQLSTCRVTVQDLVPYFQAGHMQEEILRWFPTLASAEIEVVERYYRDHQADLDDEDRKIREYVAEQMRLQRVRFPEEPREVKRARMAATLRRRQKERNGEGNPG